MSYDSARVFDRIRSILAQHPRTSLSALSRQLGVDRHTLQKAIQNEGGISFREFQRELVLDHVLNLLHGDCDRALKELASDLNYSSVQAFTRFVHNASRETPARLRKRDLHPRRNPKSATNGKENA